ncbi:MAG: hypothetical protein JXB35_12230 [Anaerolineae bacterium]|nr:hypothetical protein [Anaerolineae bacterium]
MTMTVCPSCGENIRVSGELRVGRYITCPVCEEMLEIIDLNPVELDWAFYDDEDDDYEDDIDDDDDDDDDWDK